MISTRGRYALRVMTELCGYDMEKYVTLKEIAKNQNISEKYLEAIVKRLVKNGLLVGIRGKGGGYRLARSPEEYTAAEILRAADETLSPVACLEDGENKCERAAICPTLPMWRKYKELTEEFFGHITLRQIADGELHEDDLK